MLRAIYKLIDALVANREESRLLRAELQRFIREWRNRMATQEERMQAILARVNAAVALIQELRNNPENAAINDELDAIESALTGAEEPPEE